MVGWIWSPSTSLTDGISDGRRTKLLSSLERGIENERTLGRSLVLGSTLELGLCREVSFGTSPKGSASSDLLHAGSKRGSTMNIYRPKVEVKPLDFEKGSTLCAVFLDGKHIASTCGEHSRQEANRFARAVEKLIYDEEDERRRVKGLTKVSRPNV